MAIINSTIFYSTVMTLNDTSPVTMDLFDNYGDNIFFRGNSSNIVNFTTTQMTTPAAPPTPTLDHSTGGALHIQLYSPGDTGTKNNW